jgi:hypothetical protein
MPVQHIVWIKFNDGVPGERIDRHMAALATLKDRVPGVTGLSLGENFTDRAQGYTHGLIVTLEDKAALAGYAQHPHHVEVADALRADASLLALDYEF